MPPTLMALFDGGDGAHAPSAISSAPTIWADVFSASSPGPRSRSASAAARSRSPGIGLMLASSPAMGALARQYAAAVFDSIYSFPTVILGLTVMTLGGPASRP
jgi:hypothetical protein